jgi:uncharacterized membrane protein
VLRRLGPLHVILVHFPIALLIAAAAREGWSVWKHRSHLDPAVQFCVCLGAVAAVATAGLGWQFARDGAGAGMPMTLGWHRWLGTATAGAAAVTAALAARDRRHGMRGWGFRMALLVTTVLVAATGHLGGVLVFGDDFFAAG